VGRTFRDDEDQTGSDPVVVIGNGLFARRFHRAPAVIVNSSTGQMGDRSINRASFARLDRLTIGPPV